VKNGQVKKQRDQLDAAFMIARRAIEEMHAAGCSDSMIAEVLEHMSPAPDLNDKPVEAGDKLAPASADFEDSILF
jgi:hypothetical protein